MLFLEATQTNSILYTIFGKGRKFLGKNKKSASSKVNQDPIIGSLFIEKL